MTAETSTTGYQRLGNNNEQASLLPTESDSRTNAVFVPLLNRELEKIRSFYAAQQKELLDELAELEELVKTQEDATLLGPNNPYDDDDGDDLEILDEEDDDEDVPARAKSSPSRDRTFPKRHRKGSSAGRPGLGKLGSIHSYPFLPFFLSFFMETLSRHSCLLWSCPCFHVWLLTAV